MGWQVMEKSFIVLLSLTKEVKAEFDYVSFIVLMVSLFIAFLISYRISKKYKIYPKENETDKKDEEVQLQN